jgi:hypothetical protein
MTLRAALLLVIVISGLVGVMTVVVGVAGTALLAAVSLLLQRAHRRFTRPRLV